MQQHRVPDGCPLTTCEWEVALLLADGLSYAEIAARRNVKKATIHQQLWHVHKKLGVERSAQVTAVLYNKGWLKLPPPTVEEEWPSLTPGQKLYLQAFDRFLRSRGKRRRRARLEMRHMLVAMCIERQVPVPAGGHQRDAGPDMDVALAA